MQVFEPRANARSTPTSQVWRRGARRYLAAIVTLYFVGVWCWVIVHAVYGDRFWWSFLLNSLAVYLFFPLPLTFVLAVLLRRRRFWLGFTATLLLGLYLYGPLLLPTRGQPLADRNALTVMSYNVLGFNSNIVGVIAAIREADADIIGFQELNFPIAEALEQELRSEYPYQLLDPQRGVSGMGVISRYPLRTTGAVLRGEWTGRPQVMEVQWATQVITLVNVHTRAPDLGTPRQQRTTQSVNLRRQQVQTLLEFVQAHPGPLLVTADLNETDKNQAYAIVTKVLQDSWREAGTGLGHTFPGSASQGSSRPRLLGIPIPMWLVRIDYVFHSSHWQAIRATVGPWDGASDHRPTLAVLVLREEKPG